MSAETNAQRRKVPAEVLDAAMALVNTLAANPAFRAQIAEEEIAQRIDDGSLIPIERLQVAPGLELIPVGRHADLERAAKRVVKAWLDIPNEQGWTDEEVVLSRAVKGLAALFDVDAVDSDSDADITGTDHTPPLDVIGGRDGDEPDDTDAADNTADEVATSTSAPSTEVVKLEEAEANRDSVPSDEGEEPMVEQVSGPPQDMPDGDDTGPCEECGAAIAQPDQARLSWILTRRKLCRSCHTGESPAVAAQPDEENDAASGES